MSTYLQRQPNPAPASGVSPPAPPVPGNLPAASESAPVELPDSGGDLRVVFSSGKQMTFDVGDLGEFELGVGKLETPPIPIGEFITASAAIGSHNPVQLVQPSLVLEPVVGSISAAEISRYRAAGDSKRSGTRTVFGAIAAVPGGIVGGLAGLVGGGILGAAAGTPLGPVGAVAGGGAGALYGAKHGAQKGGEVAGGISDSVFNWLTTPFQGDYNLTARLDQGQITGTIGLHYTPFVRLTLAAIGFDWLAEITAELQTALNLVATAGIALSGSNVVLHFHDGKLVRTEFTLTPSASLKLALTAEARLRLAGSLLNILDESAGRDEGLISGELTTPSFHLFDITGAIGAQTSFTFAKGSPLEILKRNIRAASGATRERFTAGIQAGGPRIPLLKKPDALNEKSRTGESETDAILMVWHKPAEWYPDYLTRPGHGKRAEKIAKFPHKVYDNGLAMGVDHWPYEGKTLKYRGGEEPRGSGVARFIRELHEEGIVLEDDLAYKADIDHVIDWAFTGEDNETNLWPLERSANRSAGVTQNRHQHVWWSPAKGGKPRYTRIEEVPPGRWFAIKSIRDPDGKSG